jgi:glutaredoxin
LTEVILYTKAGCHLCERVLEKLEELNVDGSFKISTRDITQSKELFERYQYLIPVVEVDGKIRLAGASLSNTNTLNGILRKAVLSSS